jgi:hypothetical protein
VRWDIDGISLLVFHDHVLEMVAYDQTTNDHAVSPGELPPLLRKLAGLLNLRAGT